MSSGRTFSRRRMVGALGALGAAGLATALVPVLERDDAAASNLSDLRVPFYGPHQAGIATPAQDRLYITAFNVETSNRGALTDLLQRWTVAAAKMCNGDPVGEVAGNAAAPPDDTGEALGLLTGRLTMTFGFGATLFEKDGNDRFGIADRRPAALADLPIFPGDVLDLNRSGGDIVVQACGDDPQVVFHAVRNLARIGRGLVTMHWSQLGFGRTSTTSSAQATPRNLMGFLDGTNNITLEKKTLLDEHVWVPDADGPAWMNGGTYMVTRRIRMLIEAWDRTSLGEQERVIGREKVSGAPLGRSKEHDPVNLDARGRDGLPLIDMDAHIRLASPTQHGGAKLLRRGYSFTDGMDPVTSQLDAGLFFIAFQRDPHAQFVPIQRQLAQSDLLNEYIKHTASGLYAVPPGVSEGGWIGSGLFA